MTPPNSPSLQGAGSNSWLRCARLLAPAAATLAAVLLTGSFSGAAAAQHAPAHLPLKTRWASEVSPTHVLPEYPRPQLVRSKWQNLNGRWEYAIRDSGAPAPGRYDGTMLVPFPVESQLSGVERAVTGSQYLWYRRKFQAPRLAPGERLLLHFGAVDWEAAVTVNGRLVGQHRGGYDPFTLDITDALRGGSEQELRVRVWDPTDQGFQPFGKQTLAPADVRYTAVTGIWQTVWLEPVPRASVRALEVTPDVDAGVVRLHATATGAAPRERVRVVVLDGTRPVGEASGRVADTVAVKLPHARLWSPDHPFLYNLRVSLSSGDQVKSYFGMRKVAVARDSNGINRLFLNGKPLFQLGLLDQGWWPDGLYTAPTDVALRYDIEQAKRLGFNLLRKHVKVEPARWYYHADRLGMLVWQDMPSARKINAAANARGYARRYGLEGRIAIPDSVEPPGARPQFAEEFRRVVDALRHFPAIVMWVAFNEAWGQHDTERYTAWLKAYDPTRLADDVSGAMWNDAGVGDVIDSHDYPGPEMPPLEPRRAAVQGEFGGTNLVVPGHVWGTEGDNAGGQARTLPQLDSLYRTMIRQVQGLAAKGLAAAVYTQLTDVEGELNGVVTYDRAVVKLSPEAVRENTDLIRGRFPAAISSP